MAEIRNLTRNGETFYPLTTTSAVINESTGEGLVIDEKPILNSKNLVESGGIEKQDTQSLANAIKIEQYFEEWNNKVVKMDGTINQSVSVFKILLFNTVPGCSYLFSAKFSSQYNSYFINWFDENGNFISHEYPGIFGSEDLYEDTRITAPENAYFLYMNCEKGNSDYYKLKKIEEFSSAAQTIIDSSLSPYDSKNLLPINSRLDENTVFLGPSAEFWGKFHGADVTIVEDYVRVSKPQTSSGDWPGIRINYVPSIGEKVHIKFRYRSITPIRLIFQSNLSYLVPISEEWNIFELEMEVVSSFDRIQISYPFSKNWTSFDIKDFFIYYVESGIYSAGYQEQQLEDLSYNLGNNILPISSRLDNNTRIGDPHNWYFFRSTGEINNGRVVVNPITSETYSGIRFDEPSFISVNKPVYYSFKFKSNNESRMMILVGSEKVDEPKNYRIFTGGNNEEKTISGKFTEEVIFNRLQISYFLNPPASSAQFEVWDMYIWQESNSTHTSIDNFNNEILNIDKNLKNVIKEDTLNITDLMIYNGGLSVNGDIIQDSKFSYSDYIDVIPGMEIEYSAWPGNETISCIQGFDANKNYQCSLLTGKLNCIYIQKTITIPFNISYIRVCSSNISHPNYYNETNIISKKINKKIYKEILLYDALGGIFWTIDSSIDKGDFCVAGVGSELSISISTTQNVSDVIKTIPAEKIFDGIYKFKITEEDLELGGKYLRFKTTSGNLLRLAYYLNEDSISSINNVVNFSPLRGKNVVILGDSISTCGNNVKTDQNAVEITIQPEDVGVSLSAYITDEDVKNGLNLNGVTFTIDDIGNEVTFTPSSNDVGKVVGIPLNYNRSNLKVWWKWVKEKFDCNIIPVCWSGSGLTRNRATNNAYKASYAWHESQIRKCGIRISGSMDRISPDVIIITRGGNDFTHSPFAYLTDGYFDNYNIQYPETDLREDGNYGFKEGYLLTIGKLREAYPLAKIILCTFTPFLRNNASHFPPNNGYFSEPQYNNAVREIANFCGCEIIEFDKCGITFENIYPTYAQDSEINPVHPNYRGHELMGKFAINTLINMNFE